MCLVLGFRTIPFEKITDEEMTKSKSEKSKDSIAVGNINEIHGYILWTRGILWQKDALIVAVFRYFEVKSFR